jgi:phosphoglycerate kinase
MGLDIGPATALLFSEALSDANTILWNGPMGVYEMDKFAKGSTKISHAVASHLQQLLLVEEIQLTLVRITGDEDEMTFISTGGGASLELIEGKILTRC